MVWSPISQNNPRFSRDVCSLDAERGWTPIYQGWGCISHQENRSLGAANAVQRVRDLCKPLQAEHSWGAIPAPMPRQEPAAHKMGRQPPSERWAGWGRTSRPGDAHTAHILHLRRYLKRVLPLPLPASANQSGGSRSCGPARKRHRGRVFRSLRKVRPLKSHLDLG